MKTPNRDNKLTTVKITKELLENNKYIEEVITKTSEQMALSWQEGYAAGKADAMKELGKELWKWFHEEDCDEFAEDMITRITGVKDAD